MTLSNNSASYVGSHSQDCQSDANMAISGGTLSMLDSSPFVQHLGHFEKIELVDSMFISSSRRTRLSYVEF